MPNLVWTEEPIRSNSSDTWHVGRLGSVTLAYVYLAHGLDPSQGYWVETRLPNYRAKRHFASADLARADAQNSLNGFLRDTGLA